MARTIQSLPGDILISLGARPGLVLRSFKEMNFYAPLFSEKVAGSFTRFQGYDILRVSPDYTKAAAVQSYNSSTQFYIFDLDNPNSFIMTSVSVGAITDIAWSPDSSEVAVASSTSPYVRLLDAATLTQKANFNTVPTVRINSVQYSPNGNYLYCGQFPTTSTSGINNGFYTFDLAANDMVDTSAAESYLTTGDVAISPDNAWIVGMGRAGNTQVRILAADNLTGAAQDIGTGFNFATTVNKRCYFTQDGAYCVFIGSTAPYVRVSAVEWGAGIGDHVFTLQTLNGDVPATSLDNWRFNWLTNREFVIYDGQGLKLATINGDGTVTFEMFENLPSGVSGIAAFPGFVRRKFAGTVVDASANPVEREIRVIDRETGRYLARTFSDEITGAFEIEVSSPNPAIVYCVGQGAEITKLSDGVTPVPL